jgi:hypothetical protein
VQAKHAADVPATDRDSLVLPDHVKLDNKAGDDASNGDDQSDVSDMDGLHFFDADIATVSRLQKGTHIQADT